MITIICIGKIKEKFIVDGINEYLKRLQNFTKINIIELKEETIDKNIDTIVEKESKEIIKSLEKNKGYVILLDIKGKMYNSEKMSEYITKLQNNGQSNIIFIIGGSYGVSQELKEIVNDKISFSKMTFPHQLMRLIFMEQLYRWFGIIKNIKYHK